MTESRVSSVAALANPKSSAQDFTRPGHIFPLRAVTGGVLRREGHTEASIDFARLAGLAPAGVLCEIVTVRLAPGCSCRRCFAHNARVLIAPLPLPSLTGGRNGNDACSSAEGILKKARPCHDVDPRPYFVSQGDQDMRGLLDVSCVAYQQRHLAQDTSFQGEFGPLVAREEKVGSKAGMQQRGYISPST